MATLLRAAALAGLSAVLLAGCQSTIEKNSCPVVTVLATTSSMTVFKDGYQGDPSGQLYSIQATRVDSSCDFDRDEGVSDSNITITFRATRTPKGDASSYTFPYYVASVQDGSTILAKQAYTATVNFAPGEASTEFGVTVPSTVIKLANGVKPYQYSIVVGLQLTKEQLDYQNRSGSYAP
ncbi:MAG: hypothetical protein JO348_07515 [Alphaproteobacteria bacterium]|nr:hypothetical protein [Alphaproteobacteria bacterium]